MTGSGCQTQNKHGLAAGAGTATASHWDREASGVTVSAQGSGRTTAQLQGPTSAAGIFAGWDKLDVDGDGDPNESPWHFGTEHGLPDALATEARTRRCSAATTTPTTTA